MEPTPSASSTTLAKREKSRVQFAEPEEGPGDIGSKPSLSKRDASFTSSTSGKSTTIKPRIRADEALDKSSFSKRHSRRRKFWRKVIMRSNPRYWLHILNKKLPIILPETAFRYRWDLIMLLLVCYVCFMIPYEIGFGFYPLPIAPWMVSPPLFNGTISPPAPPPLEAYFNPSIDYVVNCLDTVDWVIDGFFWVDLLLNFRSAFIDQTATTIRDGATIARVYLRTWFTLDLLACVPFDAIIIAALPNTSNDTLNGLMLLRIVRLLRLARLLRILERMRKGAWMRLAKLVFFILLIVHWITCLWFYMFRMLRLNVMWDWTFYNYVGDNSTIATYFFSAYLNTYVLMIGNDVMPGNSLERAYCSIVLAIGACFYAIILGNISLLVTNLAPTAARHRLKQDIVNNTVRYLGLPNSVVHKVGEHFDHLLARNHPGSDGMQMLQQLPSSMHRDISVHMYSDLVRSVPLFSDVEDAFIRHLVTRLKLQVYLSGELIFKLGDAGHEMYFVTKGHVAVLNAKKELLKIESKGGFFGELGLLATALRTATVVSLCDCDLALLSANDLVGVMNSFPESAKMVRQRAMRRLGELTAAGSVSAQVELAPSSTAPHQAAPPANSSLQSQTRHQSQPASLPLPSSNLPMGQGSVGAFVKRRVSDIDGAKIGPPALTKAGSLLRQGSLIRSSPHMSPNGGFRDSPSAKLRQDASLLASDGFKRVSDDEGLWGDGNYSEEDTLKLLDDVHDSVVDLTGRLQLIHGSINDVNSRLSQVESPAAVEPEVTEFEPTEEANLDLDM